MSQYQTSRIIDTSKLISYVTVVGKLTPLTPDDYMKLVRLAYEFRKAVLYATRMIAKGLNTNGILRKLRSMLNKAYGDSAYKIAKTIVKGCEFNGGNPRHIKVKKLFIISNGESSRFGNRNVRFESINIMKVKYPYDGSWIMLRAAFGRKYVSLIQDVVELTKEKKLSYGARIVFRDGRIYLHISIPIALYLQHFKRGDTSGELIAGFDLNADRINMVIVDRYGKIRDIMTRWFPEVTSHGFPKSKARTMRLEALAKLLKYAYHHSVGVVVFENLLNIKRRKFTKNPVANRKITKFAKRMLLKHGIVMAMKYGFRILQVDPKGTTHSREHNEVMKKYGLDKHTASAYIIALKGLKQL
ncbi:MAG: hypothetical protein J7L82_05825 [Staphylothermus sp.]|nr:hypothetical protein [Staphylothermus sp.]